MWRESSFTELGREELCINRNMKKTKARQPVSLLVYLISRLVLLPFPCGCLVNLNLLCTYKTQFTLYNISGCSLLCRNARDLQVVPLHCGSLKSHQYTQINSD